MELKKFKEFKDSLNESIKSVEKLVDDYRSYMNDLESEHIDAFLNFDDPIGAIGSYILKDKEGFQKEFKDYLESIGVGEYDDKYRDRANFVSLPDVRKRIKVGFDAKEKEILTKTVAIEKELNKLYPVLAKLREQMPHEDPIQGTEIYKNGKLWSVTTPGYYNDDIAVTPEEVAEYKKFLKDAGIKTRRR